MKKFPLIISLALLAASCNPFNQPIPAGVVKSVNGGVDWQFANALKGSTSANLSSLSISKLAFSPLTSQTLLAGTYTDGLFESDDAAGSWSKILSDIDVYDFVIDPTNPKIIYAAGFYADHGRVLETMDGGGSWVQIYNEESDNNPVRSIAINPTDSSQIVIGTASGTVIKSADGGDSWQLAKNFSDQVNRVLWQNGNIFVLLKTKGLFVSPDFGQTFTEITTGLHKTYSLAGLSYSQANSISTFSQVYVDFTSPALIYLTTDQGLYKTVDGGKTWQIISLPVNPTGSAAHGIAVALTSSNIVYTSVGSTVYKSLDGGQSWQTQGINSGGFINYILADPALPQIVYAGIYSTQ
jgi:photosystem II stability/assembly factor-like uncharacterized protein